MQLAHPVVEVLPQPVAVAHELAQGLGGCIVQPRGHGALLEAEPGQRRCVDRVGLGAFELRFLETPCDDRIEQDHVMASRGERRVEVLPVAGECQIFCV